MGIGTILVFNGLKIIIVCVRYLLTIWSIVVHRVPKNVLQAITRLIVPVLLAHMVLFVLGYLSHSNMQLKFLVTVLTERTAYLGARRVVNVQVGILVLDQYQSVQLVLQGPTLITLDLPFVWHALLENIHQLQLR